MPPVRSGGGVSAATDLISDGSDTRFGASAGLRGFLFQGAGGVARNHRAGWHVLGNNTACANDGVFTDGNSAQQGRAGTDGRAALDPRSNALPIRLGLQRAVRVRGSRIAIIDKSDIVPDKNLVFQRHALADKGVAGYLAAVADPPTITHIE